MNEVDENTKPNRIDDQELSIFNTALSALVKSGQSWTCNDKTVENAEQYAELAATFTKEATRHLRQGKDIYCSFCSKSQHEVKKLVAGPNVFICDECNVLVTEIVSKEVDNV